MGEATKNGKFPAHSEEGFTLIEISIAVLILAVSLVTLLGLQSASVERTLRDRNKQQAMLMARDIMAQIESTVDPVEPKELNGTVKEVLDKLEFDAPGLDKQNDPRNQFQADLRIESWSVPGTKEDAVRRVLLRIFWSPDPSDSVELVYFIPSEDDESL